MSDNIRVGLIGYGYASKTFHAPLIDGTPGLELAVISSSDAAKVKADWPSVTVVSEPKHLFNDPNIDSLLFPRLTIPTSRWPKQHWKRVNMSSWINLLP